MAFPSKGTLISEWEESAVPKYIRDFHDQQLELMGGLKMRRITNAADDPKAQKQKEEQEYAEDRAFETWLSTQSASYQAAYRTYQRDEKELDEQNDRVDEKISKRLEKLQKEKTEIERQEKDVYDNHSVRLKNGEHAIQTKEGAVCVNEKLETTHTLDDGQKTEFEQKKNGANILTAEQIETIRKNSLRIKGQIDAVDALQHENKSLKEHAEEFDRRIKNREVTNENEFKTETDTRREAQNRIESSLEGLDGPDNKQITSYAKRIGEGGEPTAIGENFNGAATGEAKKQIPAPVTPVQTPAPHL